MYSEDLILHQIVADFEELARLTQRAIEALPSDDPRGAMLCQARDAAFQGAVLTRSTLGLNSN
jgi:hypothetical protein